jgi:hypothetical protein
MTPPDLGSNSTGFTTLSSTLWRLREVLDELLFKIFETQLVIRSGQNQWLAKASRELDSALQEARHVEVMRAVETLELAQQLGRPAELTLRELAGAAQEPWDIIFDEHREALLGLTAEVSRASVIPERPQTRRPRRSGRAGSANDIDDNGDLDADVIRKFLVETLGRAEQVSLRAFLA